jgi:hypothetical protein
LKKTLGKMGLLGKFDPKDPTIALFYASGLAISHIVLIIGNIIVRYISPNYNLGKKTPKNASKNFT